MKFKSSINTKISTLTLIIKTNIPLSNKFNVNNQINWILWQSINNLLVLDLTHKGLKSLIKLRTCILISNWLELNQVIQLILYINKI